MGTTGTVDVLNSMGRVEDNLEEEVEGTIKTIRRVVKANVCVIVVNSVPLLDSEEP